MTKDGHWRRKNLSEPSKKSLNLPNNDSSIQTITLADASLEKRSSNDMYKEIFPPNAKIIKKEKKRRRNKRKTETYINVIDKLEFFCDKMGDQMKNPFKRIKKKDTNKTFISNLGSPDKIIGILQTYDFFAPLSKN